MHIPLALLIEHDLVDYVNAASTVVIAFFTVVTGVVVWRQLRASKDIERAWVMLSIGNDEFNELFLVENQHKTEGEEVSVTTTALLQLGLKNEGGNGPVWVQRFQARLVLVDSEKDLPEKPKLSKEDDQKPLPGPFADTATIRFRATANRSQVSKNLLIIYGKLTYLDKFKEERFSTFGYVILDDHGNFARLKAHPEYNQNT